MTSIILLVIILGFPLFLGLFFRVASSHIFFSLMAGELLAKYFGEDLYQILKSVSLNDRLASYSDFILLIMPMVATAFLLRGTMKKRHMLWQIIPLAFTGIVFAAFALHMLPVEVQESVSQEQVGKYLLELDGAVVAIVVIGQLVALWVQNRMAHAKEGKKHK